MYYTNTKKGMLFEILEKPENITNSHYSFLQLVLFLMNFLHIPFSSRTFI